MSLSLNIERWGREQYLNSIEMEDKKQARFGQGLEALDDDDLSEAKEHKLIKWEESLSAHGMHVVSI